MIETALALLFLTSPAFATEKNQPTYRDREENFRAFSDLSGDKYKEVASSSASSPVGTVYWLAYPSEHRPDKNLGFRNPALTQVRQAARTDQEMIFDVVYTYDKFGRRITEVADPRRRRRFAILSGCSFTHGNGVADNQTLATYLGQELSDYLPYNYGIRGTGTNSVLGLAEEGKFHDQIPQQSGVFIYISLGENHVDRSTGKLPSINWLADTPYYEQEGDQLVRHGSFRTGRPFVTNTLFLLGTILTHFHLGSRVLPPVTTADNDFVCAMVKQAKKTFLDQYPGSRFIYYLHPLSEQSPRLDSCLTKAEVEFYRGTRFENPAAMIFQGDGHPTAEANKTIARELASIIRNPK